MNCPKCSSEPEPDCKQCGGIGKVCDVCGEPTDDCDKDLCEWCGAETIDDPGN